MKKVIIIFLSILAFSQLYATVIVPNIGPAVASQNREADKQRAHEERYHHSTYYTEWEFSGDYVDKVFNYKDKEGNKHYTYSLMKGYSRYVMYSCGEHICDRETKSEYIRPANNQEIQKYNRDRKIVMFALIFLGITFLTCMSLVISSEHKNPKEIK